MNFDQNQFMLLSDINIPEVFFSEYLCSANGDYVKIYLYCLFLCKHGSEISPLDLSKKLCLPLKTVEQGLEYWKENDVIIKKQNTYTFTDLKKLEVDKLYKPRQTSSPEEAVKSNSKNAYRIQAIQAINSEFFQGVMSPTWYTDIDTLFSKYKFDEDVMLALFRYCFDRQALHKKYLATVAEGWHSNNIRTINDLDNYYIEFEKLAKIKKQIIKKLGFTRKLSQYEEAYVDKWISDFKYSMDIVDLALKKTTSKTNPSFDYIDKIITDWHEHNLNSADEISEFMKVQKQKQKEVKAFTEKPSVKYTKEKITNTDSYNNLDQYYTNI